VDSIFLHPPRINTRNRQSFQLPILKLCKRDWILKEVDDKELEIIRCPFCGYQKIETEPGKSGCPECDTAFEIDDRGECVFVDPIGPRLPIEGTICPECGLVQGEEAENCLYCGGHMNKRLQ
jgi:hypothetical protein